jgi:hypothetical protein
VAGIPFAATRSALGNPFEAYSTAQTAVALPLHDGNPHYTVGVSAPTEFANHHDGVRHNSGNVIMPPSPRGGAIPQFSRPLRYWEGVCVAEGGDMAAYANAFSPAAATNPTTTPWAIANFPENWDRNTLHSHGLPPDGGVSHNGHINRSPTPVSFGTGVYPNSHSNWQDPVSIPFHGRCNQDRRPTKLVQRLGSNQEV